MKKLTLDLSFKNTLPITFLLDSKYKSSTKNFTALSFLLQYKKLKIPRLSGQLLTKKMNNLNFKLGLLQYAYFESFDPSKKGEEYYSFLSHIVLDTLEQSIFINKDRAKIEEELKDFSDFVCKTLQNSAREYFLESSRKILKKEIVSTAKGSGKKRVLLSIEQKKNMESVTDENSLINDLLKNFLIPQKEKDIYKNKINFITFINLYIKNKIKLKKYLSDFDSQYQLKFNTISNFSLQSDQYMAQIATYILLITRIALKYKLKEEEFNVKEFLQQEDFYTVTYDTDSIIIKKVEEKNIYISFEATAEKTTSNQLVAFLNQLENFYFNKLLIIYLLTYGEAS